MFHCGETVLYGTEGVCRIAEIREMKVGRTRENYYVLKPVYRESATIYVPVDNEKLVARMRRLLSAQEIDSLLGAVALEDVPWVDDPNERRTVYGEILASGDRCQQLRTAGRQLRSGDDQLLREAEKLLHDEFALVLAIPQQEVPAYIRSRIEAGENTAIAAGWRQNRINKGSAKLCRGKREK